VAGRWAYLSGAVDEHGHVIDVLREHRDLASARAFFARVIRRRRVAPDRVITDTHPAYVRAGRRHARGAVNTRTGLHRARGETTKTVERSHVPVKDRRRPMRGLQSIASGQRLLKGIEAAQAIRRGDLRASADTPAVGRRGAARADRGRHLSLADRLGLAARSRRHPHWGANWPRLDPAGPRHLHALAEGAQVKRGCRRPRACHRPDACHV
jgi:hypothetical protein